MLQAPRSSGVSARHLAQAPHRLMFFIGAGNVLMAMSWWAVWLASTRCPQFLAAPQPSVPAGWLHAFLMQYLVLPSFVFGFLFTVFPRWMGLPASFASTDRFELGRAPAHALFVGFFGSLLVAMVTRVTQGHSGRPLVMPAAAWFAFIAVQVVAVMRIVAEIAPDAYAWHVAAAIGWLIAFLPWVTRLGLIHLTPRADGQPG